MALISLCFPITLAAVRLPSTLFVLLLSAFALVAPGFAAEKKTGEKKRYILYATFLNDTPVELSDGARWMMDRGDSFPILMFKEQQTMVVLQFAGTQFAIETSRVKVTPGDEVTPEMVATYRRNVAGYVDGKSEKILQELKPTKEQTAQKSTIKGKKPVPRF